VEHQIQLSAYITTPATHQEHLLMNKHKSSAPAGENATQTIKSFGVAAESQTQQSIQKGFYFTEGYDKHKYPC